MLQDTLSAKALPCCIFTQPLTFCQVCRPDPIHIRFSLRRPGGSSHAWRSKSQSFIHQVSVSLLQRKYWLWPAYYVAILYSSSLGFSQRNLPNICGAKLRCRNPLFIKSRFLSKSNGSRVVRLSIVAILYSSSLGFSQRIKPSPYGVHLILMSQSFIHQVSVSLHKNCPHCNTPFEGED